MSDTGAENWATDPVQCVAMLKTWGMGIAHVPRHLLTEEICLAAVNHTPMAMVYVPIALQTMAVCLAAINIQVGAMSVVTDVDFREEVFIEAAKTNWQVLHQLSHFVEPYYRVYLEACRNDVRALSAVEGMPPKTRSYLICHLMVDKIAPLLAINLSMSPLTTIAEEYMRLLEKEHIAMYVPWHVLWKICETIKCACR